MPAKKDSNNEIQVEKVFNETIPIRLRGLTPLYCHRMGAKAKEQLLLGGRKKTATEKRTEIKHDPRAEFRDSMSIVRDFDEYTDVAFPAMAIKSAMATAALMVPGVTKTDVQRLVFIPDEWVPVYGIPKLRMDIVRSADINKTPDVRSRAFFPEWWTQVNIQFITPYLTREAIGALLHNAGIMCGIGDFRQEKGKGNYGTFEVAGLDAYPAHLLDRAAQREAIANPVSDNPETAELLALFDVEKEKRK